MIPFLKLTAVVFAAVFLFHALADIVRIAQSLRKPQ